ncbi:MAG TPA: DUF541 domain-containing protein [Armatimonadetes bacterium]|nr:DUF541 domain-containing protein [Armatimonadota bacterium]
MNFHFLRISLFLLVFTTAAGAQMPMPMVSGKVISVFCVAEAKVPPDAAELQITLEAQGANLTEAFTAVQQQVEELRARLQEEKIPAADIVVDGPKFVSMQGLGALGGMGMPPGGAQEQARAIPGVQPTALVYTQAEEPSPGIGELAQATVHVRLPMNPDEVVESLRRVDDLKAALAEDGYPVDRVTFILRNQATAEPALFQDALAKARPLAQAAAQAVGVKLGALHSIMSFNMGEMMRSVMQGMFGGLGPLGQMMGMLFGGGGGSTDPTAVTVTQMVVVNFAFE